MYFRLGMREGSFDFSRIVVHQTIHLHEDGWFIHANDDEQAAEPLEPCELTLEYVFSNEDGDPGFNYRIDGSNESGPELTMSDIIRLAREEVITLESM